MNKNNRDYAPSHFVIWLRANESAKIGYYRIYFATTLLPFMIYTPLFSSFSVAMPFFTNLPSNE